MKGSIEHQQQSGRKIVEKHKDLPVRISLRAATHDLHERLNQHPLLAGLIKPDYPLENYQKLLFIYFQIYQRLENKIQQFLLTKNCAFDYVARTKLPWIEKDLAFFELDSLTVPNMEIAVHAIDNVGQLIGTLYTIEGSTLGGQLISRRLADHHNLTQTAGARFFNGYGEHTLSMWQEFIRFSETIANDDNLFRASEKAACQTFQLFNQVLDNYSQIELSECSF
jgi:heme oxygenase